MTTPYARPELTEEENRKAGEDAIKLIRKHGIYKLGSVLALLCQENRRLVKEINEHRAARDIEPLPTYEV